MKKLTSKLILSIILLIAFNIIYIDIAGKCVLSQTNNANISYCSPEKQAEDNGRMRKYIYKDTLKESLKIHIPILIIIDSTVITVYIKKYRK